jgi:hypothetical protein
MEKEMNRNNDFKKRNEHTKFLQVQFPHDAKSRMEHLSAKRIVKGLFLLNEWITKVWCREWSMKKYGYMDDSEGIPRKADDDNNDNNCSNYNAEGVTSGSSGSSGSSSSSSSNYNSSSSSSGIGSGFSPPDRTASGNLTDSPDSKREEQKNDEKDSSPSKQEKSEKDSSPSKPERDSSPSRKPVNKIVDRVCVIVDLGSVSMESLRFASAIMKQGGKEAKQVFPEVVGHT